MRSDSTKPSTCGHHTPATAPLEASAPAAYVPLVAAVGIYLLHGQFLSVNRTATTRETDANGALHYLLAVPPVPVPRQTDDEE